MTLNLERAGEANTDYNRNLYKCTFPAMITDWRQKWYTGTDGYTQILFPFGFVQVNLPYSGGALVSPAYRCRGGGSAVRGRDTKGIEKIERTHTHRCTYASIFSLASWP